MIRKATIIDQDQINQLRQKIIKKISLDDYNLLEQEAMVVRKKFRFWYKNILYFKYISKTLINQPFKKLSNYFIYIFYKT